MLSYKLSTVLINLQVLNWLIYHLIDHV